MHFVICGARKRDGTICARTAIRGSRRCLNHGGLAVGPRSITARLAAGERLKLYRVTGTARKGIPNGTKIKDRKARGERNRQLVAERQDRRQFRAERWRRKQLITRGLPLFTEAELEKL